MKFYRVLIHKGLALAVLNSIHDLHSKSPCKLMALNWDESLKVKCWAFTAQESNGLSTKPNRTIKGIYATQNILSNWKINIYAKL